MAGRPRSPRLRISSGAKPSAKVSHSFCARSAYLHPVPASLPFIEPCRPRPVKCLPRGDAWLHEPKLDGWRIQVVTVGSEIALYSLNGRDLKGFASVLDAVRKLPCKSVALDCELVLMGPEGIDFYSLMKRTGENVALMAFDILELNGSDLRPLPLAARKIYLWKLLSRNKSSNLAVVPSFEGGEELMLAVMKHSLEGVVSKRRSAPYASGSRPEWVKVKSPTWRQANKDRWELMHG